MKKITFLWIMLMLPDTNFLVKAQTGIPVTIIG